MGMNTNEIFLLLSYIDWHVLTPVIFVSTDL
jgi:hypothetical protein